MLSELPNMVTVLEQITNFNSVKVIQGGLHVLSIDESIPYFMPFACALQNLLPENYDSFLVIIGCNTV